MEIRKGSSGPGPVSGSGLLERAPETEDGHATGSSFTLGARQGGYFSQGQGFHSGLHHYPHRLRELAARPEAGLAMAPGVPTDFQVLERDLD